MPLPEIRAELKRRGVSTAGFFEKAEYVEALRQARLSDPSGGRESEAAYDDDVVEVETVRMPRGAKESQQQQRGGPFGGGNMPGGMGGMGGMPSGMPGGMGGMGGIGDILSGMGGGAGGSPFGGGGVPGGMGGMGGIADILNGMGGGAGGGAPGGAQAMEMLQKMMGNPKAMALFQKAQQNPKVMAALQDVQAQNFSPQAMAKYANDKDLMELLEEFKRIM